VKTHRMLSLLVAALFTMFAIVRAEDAKPQSQKIVEDEDAAKRLVAIAAVYPKKIAANRGSSLHAVSKQIHLDGSQSKPADLKLTYQWKQTGGEDLQCQPNTLQRKLVGLPMYKVGTFKFQLTVSDGTYTSEPSEVEFEVVEPGPEVPFEKREVSKELVAFPEVTPNPAAVNVRGNAAVMANQKIIILDGSKSTPASESLEYYWKQTGGDDLKLQEHALSKDRVGLRIFKTGKYTFQLIVADEKRRSERVEVELDVVDPEAARAK
jgi:hypothetical protein